MKNVVYFGFVLGTLDISGVVVFFFFIAEECFSTLAKAFSAFHTVKTPPERSWGAQLTPADPRDIPYHAQCITLKEEGKGGLLEQWCLPSQVIIKGKGALHS